MPQTTENIILEIKTRLNKAMDTHRQERSMEFPCIRTKEAAWGKIVAYAHCLRLVTDMDYGLTKRAIKESIAEIDGDQWTKSREIKAMIKAYKMIRKKEDEIAAIWEMHISSLKDKHQTKEL